MHNFLQYFIDFLFPPSPEEIELRSFSPAEVFHRLPPASETEFTFISSIFSYKNPLVREIVWQIKYKKNTHAIKCAGFAFYEKLINISEEKIKTGTEKIVLIPIPLSKKRRRERGYNQCELLIDEIVKFDSQNETIHRISKNYNLLIRAKHIEKQTHKNRNERIENTKQIFELTPDFYEKIEKDSFIVLIDDVSTTGSTLKEARDTLLKAGYTNVEALTFAH